MMLTCKSNIPLWLEVRLIRKYGYAIHSRISGESVTFIKSKADKRKGVSEAREAELIVRCDRIVDYFPDPYKEVSSVRARLINMSRTLPMEESQVVIEYTNENFPESASEYKMKA